MGTIVVMFSIAVLTAFAGIAQANDGGCGGEQGQKYRRHNFKKIAKKYNVDADALKEWNHMRHKNPKAGQKLTIYTTKKYNQKEKKEEKAAKEEETKASKKDKNKKKDALKKKKNDDNEDEDTPKKKNTKDKKAKKEGGAVNHTVKKGETLSAISKKYDVSVEDLMKLNKIGAKGSINAGQVIKIKKN